MDDMKYTLYKGIDCFSALKAAIENNTDIESLFKDSMESILKDDMETIGKRNMERLFKMKNSDAETWTFLMTPNFIIDDIIKKNNTRYDKVQNKRVNTITTIVRYDTNHYGIATCDESEYDEREGVLNAIANSVFGNFDKAYDRYKKQEKKKYQMLCKCSTCGKTYDTPEQARECETQHIKNKKERRERYCIRAEAKRRLATEEYEKKVKDMMNKISEEENTN